MTNYFNFRSEHLPISDNNVTTTNDHLDAADYDNESDIDVSITKIIAMANTSGFATSEL